MAEESNVAAQPLSHLLIETLLDWPFLLFLLLATVLILSRGQIAQIIQTRQIDVSLGGNTISIGEAVRELDNETSQAIEDFRRHQDEIETLKAAVARLEVAQGAAPSGTEPEMPPAEAPAAPGAPGGGSRRPGSFERMLDSISSSKYRWRSLERLAIEARVSEKEARDILKDHADQVVLGKSQTGKMLARLKETSD